MTHSQDPEERTASQANGKPAIPELAEVAELAQGESIDHWAERFAATMEQQEAEQEKKRPRWTPLSLLGLRVR